ncbi:MAG: hypothetical protein LBJ10_00285, partial [Clostridiales bacterium]|nr:hypothetical protein [Clostridiales bacterium]
MKAIREIKPFWKTAAIKPVRAETVRAAAMAVLLAGAFAFSAMAYLEQGRQRDRSLQLQAQVDGIAAALGAAGAASAASAGEMERMMAELARGGEKLEGAVAGVASGLSGIASGVDGLSGKLDDSAASQKQWEAGLIERIDAAIADDAARGAQNAETAARQIADAVRAAQNSGGAAAAGALAAGGSQESSGAAAEDAPDIVDGLVPLGGAEGADGDAGADAAGADAAG